MKPCLECGTHNTRARSSCIDCGAALGSDALDHQLKLAILNELRLARGRSPVTLSDVRSGDIDVLHTEAD